MRFCRWLACLLWLACPLKAQELPCEFWQVTYLYGARVGYSHTDIRRDKDRLVCETSERMSVRRMGSVLTTESFRHYEESEEGQPLGFTYRTTSGDANTEIQGQVRGATLEVQTRNAERTTESQQPWDTTIMFPVAAARMMGHIQLKEGVQFHYRTLTPSMGLSGQTLRYEVLGRQNVAVLDQRLDLWRCRVTVDEVPGLEVFDFLDDKFDSWRTEVPSLSMVSVRGSREVALAPLDPKDTPDTMVCSGVRANLQFFRPRQVTQARYRLRGITQVPGDIVARQQDFLEVLITVPAWPQVDPGPAGTDLKRYLEPNAYLHCQDPQIQEAAAQASQGLDRPRAVLALREFVRRQITVPSMDVGFASDLETLASHKGDCTEHAVLLASLCRARGIPARIATGLVYAGGIFAGHCWTEVNLGGAWYPVDAALGGPSCDATHLKLSDSSLNDPGVGAELSNTLGSLGRIQIEVVDYVESGHSWTAEGAAPVLSDGTLSWPRFGLGFQIPQGWQRLSEKRLLYPSNLALQSPQGCIMSLSCQEYGDRDFLTVVDDLGGGLATPRLAKTVDGKKAVLVVGGDQGRREITLLVDRGDTYLVWQMHRAPEDTVSDFMTVVNSLKLGEP